MPKRISEAPKERARLEALHGEETGEWILAALCKWMGTHGVAVPEGPRVPAPHQPPVPVGERARGAQVVSIDPVEPASFDQDHGQVVQPDDLLQRPAAGVVFPQQGRAAVEVVAGLAQGDGLAQAAGRAGMAVVAVSVVPVMLVMFMAMAFMAFVSLMLPVPVAVMRGAAQAAQVAPVEAAVAVEVVVGAVVAGLDRLVQQVPVMPADAAVAVEVGGEYVGAVDPPGGALSQGVVLVAVLAVDADQPPAGVVAVAVGAVVDEVAGRVALDDLAVAFGQAVAVGGIAVAVLRAAVAGLEAVAVDVFRFRSST